MKIAFVGKGGSGKSTAASLFARYLAYKKQPVLVVDGDINQHLGEALGFERQDIAGLPALGQHQKVLNDYIRGSNPRIASTDHIIETTPAGRGSGLIWFNQPNPVFDHYQIEKNGIRFMSVGAHSDEEVGSTCFHKFTGAFGTFLNHLMDDQGEYVIGDMCAGADPFASCSLATRFDAVFLIVEPTLKSVGVYDQCRKYGDPFGVKIFVIGNKIEDQKDIDFIRNHVGEALVAHFVKSDFIRDQERGQFQDIGKLESHNLAVLSTIKTITDGLQRDWESFRKSGLHFHKQAATGWANDMLKADMGAQYDPDFRQEDLILPMKDAA